MEHRITVEGDFTAYCTLQHDGTDYNLLRALIDYLVHGISFVEDKTVLKITVEKLL